MQDRLWLAASREVLSSVTLGVAHDLNNLLTGVFSISDLCLRDITADHPLHAQLQLIRSNGQRATELIRTLFHEYQANPGRREIHDFNFLVQINLELARRAISKSIQTSLILAAEPLPVAIDAVAFRTVFLHLVLNASEAMDDRGKLQFQTARHPKLPRLPNFTGIKPKGSAVSLEIRDTGGGVDPAFQKQLFQPLFTTKAANGSGGLGLYLAREFAESSGGGMAVESNNDGGSTVTVYLPVGEFADPAATVEIKPKVALLAGNLGSAKTSLIRQLRRRKWDVKVVARSDETLVPALPGCDVLIVALKPSDAGTERLIRAVRRQRLPVKVAALARAAPPEELATRIDLLVTGKPDIKSIAAQLDA